MRNNTAATNAQLTIDETRRGTAHHVQGVTYTVRRWKALGGPTSWRNASHTISETVMQEQAALQLMQQLIGDKVVLEYGPYCDKLRVNSLLRLYGMAPLNFFNMGDGVSYQSGGARPRPVRVFGMGGIVQTPTAILTILKERTWDVFGQNPSVIQPTDPHVVGRPPGLRDIPTTGRPHSDPSLDVQRLWNIFYLFWRVFNENDN